MIQQTLRIYQRAYRGLAPSVWLLAGVMLINRCGTMVLPYMSLYLTQYLHYTVTQTGVVMAIYGLGTFVGTFLGGRLTDKFGFYYVQLFSLLLSGAFLILLQFVVHFYALCGSVFIFTLFGDAFRPANQSAIAHYANVETRTRALSLNRLAINLGWAVGSGLGGWLASFNYHLLFWADGLTCMLAGVFLWLFLAVPTQSNVTSITELDEQSQKSLSQHKSPYNDTLFLGFVVCNALYLMAFFQFFTIVPLYFKEVIHINESTIGLLMALNGLLIVGIEMAMVYSFEQRNASKIKLIIRGVTLAAIAYGILSIPAWAPSVNSQASLGFAVGYIIVVTFSEMLVIPFLQSLTIDRSNHTNRGQYLALYAMSAALAQTTAPALGSLLIANVGFSIHWSAMAGLCLLSASGFWWLSHRLRNT